MRASARSVVDILHDEEEWGRSLPTAIKDEAIAHYERLLIARKLRGSRAEGSQAGRYIPREEITWLLEAYLRSETRAGRREAAIIAMAWSIDPHVHEITRLRLTDIRSIQDKDPAYEIRIIGKGNIN